MYVQCASTKKEYFLQTSSKMAGGVRKCKGCGGPVKGHQVGDINAIIMKYSFGDLITKICTAITRCMSSRDSTITNFSRIVSIDRIQIRKLNLQLDSISYSRHEHFLCTQMDAQFDGTL